MQKKYRKQHRMIPLVCILLLIGLSVLALVFLCSKRKETKESPEYLLKKYVGYIEKKDYQSMYEMVWKENWGESDKARFLERNEKIYDGIEAKNIELKNIKTETQKGKRVSISYETSMDTCAGSISFENKASFLKNDEGYQLVWSDCLIFPELTATDKISIATVPAQRGKILDRNGNVLAGTGTAVSVGLIPERITDKNATVNGLSDILQIDTKIIEKKLDASWVKEDSFVPVTMISQEKANALQEKLLSLSGVMLSDTDVRTYFLGAAAAHLIGYVQEVTAEDLEEHKGEGYSAGSVIGRSGMEGLYEKELKGQDGCSISILDEEGQKKKTIATCIRKDGQDIRLTIDSNLQQKLYDEFKEDRGCSVALQPYTGEVLALVSTPSYDNNDFIRGMSNKQWKELNESEEQPLYNRFRQTWCPGSTMKPIVAEIGLKTNTLDPNEDFGNVGRSWQKDSSWGSYYVTTLETYEPVNLENAIIHSDNIYFAKVALKIGAKNLMESLDALGFNQELPFEIKMSKSTYSNDGKIESEIQLADSGYGQGQVLVNPLHLASVYTAFLNDGNILKPYLQYKENGKGKIWIQKAFQSEHIQEVMEGMKGAVNNPEGSGYAGHRNDILLAGKTGTAELKQTKEDQDGTEIGWFVVFTADSDTETPVLLVSMVENVKDIGGSTYVVEKDRNVLAESYDKKNNICSDWRNDAPCWM